MDEWILQLSFSTPVPHCYPGFLTLLGPLKAGKEERRGSKGHTPNAHAIWDRPWALWAWEETLSH